MPERHQEQQSQKKKQGSGASITASKWLVVHHLAGETRVMFRSGSVLMEQPDAMEANKTQQRDLDNPSAYALFPMGPMSGHGLTKPAGQSYFFEENP